MTDSSRPQERSLHWSELTYERAAQLLEGGATALLPAGATEAHGPHLPLCTDVVIAQAGAERAARRLELEGIPAAVLPPLAYAVTEYASEFAGTLSIPKDTARALALDVIRAAARTGFREVVICNAHLEPGNIEVLHDAVEQARGEGLRAAFPDVTRKPHALRLGDEFKSGACHAGSYETSLVLAAQPSLVHQEIAAQLEPNPISLAKAIKDGKKTFLEAGGPRAYFGYPADATEAEGDLLYDAMADIFASAARNLRAGE
jgi:creatinine amidohydrolase